MRGVPDTSSISQQIAFGKSHLIVSCSTLSERDWRTHSRERGGAENVFTFRGQSALLRLWRGSVVGDRAKQLAGRCWLPKIGRDPASDVSSQNGENVVRDEGLRNPQGTVGFGDCD